MGQAQSELLGGTFKQPIHSNVNTLPTPTAAPTDILTTLRRGATALRSLLVKVYGHAAATSVTITGPVYAVGYHDADARWYRFAVLNSGGDIVVSDVVGWIWKLTDVPAWASALKLEATGGLSGSIDAGIDPLETSGVP